MAKFQIWFDADESQAGELAVKKEHLLRILEGIGIRPVRITMNDLSAEITSGESVGLSATPLTAPVDEGFKAARRNEAVSSLLASEIRLSDAVFSLHFNSSDTPFKAFDSVNGDSVFSLTSRRSNLRKIAAWYRDF